jgi:acetoin utilization deacetylase AcuC-like enzyme
MITYYHDAQRLHAPETFMVAGRPQPIPEKPIRIDMLMKGVSAVGSKVVEPPLVDMADIANVHDARYVSFLTTLRERWSHVPNSSDIPLPNVYAIQRSSLPPIGYPEAVVGQAGFHLGDGACPVTEHTLASALASASCALAGAKHLSEQDKLVYALCRPPGHHAASDLAAGFCFFNNAALAADYLRRSGKRTAILDIDVHHGNGTEAIFYDSADILTVSIHCHPKRFYPFFWGYADEHGRGAGEGYNLNLPLERGTDIEAYLPSLDAALRRITDFKTEALVLACGLDIAIDDPFKAFAIRTQDFATIGKRIAELKLPTLVVQEGGYPSDSLGLNLASILQGLST